MEALLTIFTLCGFAAAWALRGRYDKRTMLRLYTQALVNKADKLESEDTDNATDDTN